jgi:ketosteroid isomerase-like protein
VALEAPDAVRARIRRLEDRRYAAIIDGDVAVLDELLSDQLVYTHSTGARETKAMYLARVRSRPSAYDSIDHPEEQILTGDGVAVVIGRMIARIRSSGGEISTMTNAATAVWALERGSWRLLAYAPTPLAAVDTSSVL